MQGFKMFKTIQAFVIIFVVFTINSYSMDHEGKETDPLLQGIAARVDVEAGIPSAERNEEGGPSIRNRGVAKEDLTTDLSSERAVIYDPRDLRRTRLNRLLDAILRPPSSPPTLGEDHPELESAIIIYNPNYDNERERWSNAGIFLSEFDNRAFERPVSKKTRVIQLGAGLIGVCASWGWGPLVMYLSQSVLSQHLPLYVANTIIFSAIGTSTIAYLMQMLERGEVIGDALFDRNGFARGTSEKGPHITKLKTEIDTRTTCCRKPLYIPVPIQFMCRGIALGHAVIQTAPLALLFWYAEGYFPIYRGVFIGPLSTMIFEKSYREALESLEFLGHQHFTNHYRMLREKKDILTSRLKDMRTLIHASRSDSLVDYLYTEFQKALKEAKAVNAQERVSAASLFFLKRVDNPNLVTLKALVEEGNRNLQLQESEGTRSAVELDTFQEAVQGLADIPFVQTSYLIQDITQLPGITSMRRFLEYLSVRIPGAAEVGRFLIPLWTVSKIFETFGVTGVNINIYGLEVDPIFCTGIGVSLVEMLVRAASEWYLQNETFLGLRNIGSRSVPFWPLRWMTNVLSLFPAIYSAVPGPAIIFMLLPDAPVYLKVLLSASLFPSDMTSFYRFFKERYGNFITGLTTTQVRTTAQRRAVLDQEIARLMREIHRFDKDTTELLYNLTQKGI